MAVPKILYLIAVLSCLNSVAWGKTDPSDFAIIQEFIKGLENPEVLKWPYDNSSDPCGDKWPSIGCDGDRINQIQTKNLNLRGTLPKDFNKLTELLNIGMQNNLLSGSLPSFSGLSKLQFAYLGNNMFDTIPSDFFNGLTSLSEIALQKTPLNATNGWVLPSDLKDSAQLVKLTLSTCNLAGPLPDFIGDFSSLMSLDLSYNNISGPIPKSFSRLPLHVLKLNNQAGLGLSGPIDFVGSITQFTLLWLHGNSFTGPIPSTIGSSTSLTQVWLNNNRLVGLIPSNLTSLPNLESLRLANNFLMGPMPVAKSSNFSYDNNRFCQSEPGQPCSPQVTALLHFLESINYPEFLVSSWTLNNPCIWRGISCRASNNVTHIILENFKLNGTISPSLGELYFLTEIHLGGNNLIGIVPNELSSLPSLQLLNISDNDIGPPIPNFRATVKLIYSGNPKLDPNAPPKSPIVGPPGSSPSGRDDNPPNKSSKSKLIIIIPIAIGFILIVLAVVLYVYCRKRANKGTYPSQSSVVIEHENMVKIIVADNSNSYVTSSEVPASAISGATDAHLIEPGNLVVSVQILRNVTKNFSKEQELGRGGFGVVYKGELHDGTTIAVKRMESGVLRTKAFDEFQAEITVLSKVRHRNLVSLLGFSAEGNEKLLVYEYMPKGALSRHLFLWKEFDLDPLSWKRRLNISLDVGRAMEYLHSLANQSFIHRDLKSSNILLDDNYRAKVSDFGLVKLAPEGNFSVATRLAGTFGYLAPEYAVTGKVTTKVDVFSFGVVLIELLTGMTALDENRPEETRHLASWFYTIKSSKDQLRKYIDSSLDTTDETFKEMCIVAELAGHCTAREPLRRPDMGHAVSVLVPLVEKWKPVKDDLHENIGMDIGQPLLQMVKGWQAHDGSSNTCSINLDDSKGSIPSRPTGFADSFTSADGR